MLYIFKFFSPECIEHNAADYFKLLECNICGPESTLSLNPMKHNVMLKYLQSNQT